MVKIPAQTLRSMIGRTIFAISNEESRYTLNGGLMVLKPESITMVATDGHRLAHIEKQGEQFDVSGENKTLIPKKAMSEVYSLLQNSEVEFVEFAKDESTLVLPDRRAPADLAPTDRPVPQLRSGSCPRRRPSRCWSTARTSTPPSSAWLSLPTSARGRFA